MTSDFSLTCMWKCPKCHQSFYNKNQAHSCGNYSVADFIKGKTEVSKAIMNKFLKAYERIGPYELHPVKTRIALLTKMRFASINKLGKDYMDGHLVLTELQNNSLFYKIDNLNNRFYVHHFKIFEDTKFSSTFIKQMESAYQVGLRMHIKIRPQTG